MTHITLIAGSHRDASESSRYAAYLAKQLQAKGVETDILDLAGNPLPLWDEGLWGKDGLKDKWADQWQPWAQTLQKTDGLVVVTPEWAGMAPAGLKNLFLLCSDKEVGHKPAAIVSISAGMGGTYPVAELRMSSYKNNRLCYIPDHAVVRTCTKFLHDGVAPGDAEHNAATQARLAYTLDMLLRYAEAMKPIRESNWQDERFPYGM